MASLNPSNDGGTEELTALAEALGEPPTVVRWDLGEDPPETSRGDGAVRVCVVQIGGHRVAVPAHHTVGVRQIDSVTSVPLSAPHLIGIVHLEGRILAVLDPASLLFDGQSFGGQGRPRSGGLSTLLWVTANPTREQVQALLEVDQVESLRWSDGDYLHEADHEGPIHPLQTLWCERRISVDGEVLPLVDVRRLLSLLRDTAIRPLGDALARLDGQGASE